MTSCFYVQCVPIRGEGFVRGSYTCNCKPGYYFPDVDATEKHFDGKELESYFDDSGGDDDSDDDDDDDDDGDDGRDVTTARFRCAACSPGCDTCIDDAPCLYAMNKLIVSFLLVLTVALMLLLLAASYLIYLFRSKKVRACHATQRMRNR